MFRIQNKGHVESAGLEITGLGAFDQVEKVRGKSQVRRWHRRRQLLGSPIKLTDDQGDLPQKPFGLAQVGGATAILEVGIKMGQQAHTAAQHIHGHRAGRQLA